MTETTTPITHLELTRFEQFVHQISTMFAVLQEFTFVGVFLSGVSVAICWLIFRYHQHQLEDPEFFRDNIAVAGRFTFKTYDMFRWCCTALPPLSFCVLIFSIWTRFDTVRFISFFGHKRIKS